MRNVVVVGTSAVDVARIILKSVGFAPRTSSSVATKNDCSGIFTYFASLDDRSSRAPEISQKRLRFVSLAIALPRGAISGYPSWRPAFPLISRVKNIAFPRAGCLFASREYEARFNVCDFWPRSSSPHATLARVAVRNTDPPNNKTNDGANLS